MCVPRFSMPTSRHVCTIDSFAVPRRSQATWYRTVALEANDAINRVSELLRRGIDSSWWHAPPRYSRHPI